MNGREKCKSMILDRNVIYFGPMTEQIKNIMQDSVICIDSMIVKRQYILVDFKIF